MPLRYKFIADLQPANQKPVWDRIDLNHVGIHLADTSIVKKIHNRAYAGAKLDNFSSLNLGANESDKRSYVAPSPERSNEADTWNVVNHHIR